MGDMEPELKILMLEDLVDDAGLIERELRKAKMRFVLKRVDTRDEFLDALDHFLPDVILSDHALPQFNSIEAFKLCQQRGLSAPFVLVTGTVSEEFAVNCLKQGVDDYILKTNLSRLPSAIVSALKQHAVQLQKQEAEVSLKEQNELLLKINKELDSFVYSVSHNLRGPLASVLGLVNVARLEDTDYDPQYYFTLIEERVLNLDRTIRQILDHSKNSRMAIRPERVAVKSIVEEILWQLEYMDSNKEAKVIVDIQPDLELVTDKYRLNVILNNLLTNAFRYLDGHKEQKWVLIKAQDEGEQVRVIVEDNGIGMDDESKLRAFDMFYRGTVRSDGAGLGLYITKESIDKLGGTVAVYSEFRKGTRIEVCLLRNINLNQEYDDSSSPA